LAARIASVKERQELRQGIEQLEAEAREAAESLASNAAQAVTNLHQRLEALLTEHDALHRARIEEQNRLHTLQLATSELQRNIANIKAELRMAAQGRTRHLRLPREHATHKRPWHVIVRFGRLYPVNFLVGGSRERNTASIHWNPGVEGEEVAQPIPGRGLDPGTPGGALTVALSNLPADEYYLVYHVYEDSFPAFIKARDAPVQQGFEMTWVPLENSVDLVIRPGSDEPPPRPL
jgi:hypothetical protein